MYITYIYNVIVKWGMFPLTSPPPLGSLVKASKNKPRHKPTPERGGGGKETKAQRRLLPQLPTSSSVFSATSFPLGTVSPPPPLTAGSGLDFLASLSPWWVSSSGFLWGQNCLQSSLCRNEILSIFFRELAPRHYCISSAQPPLVRFNMDTSVFIKI